MYKMKPKEKIKNINFNELKKEKENIKQPLIKKIIKNKYRIGILYILAKEKKITPTNLAYKLGVYPRSVIYHLNKLIKWDLVKVHSKDKRGYREKFKLNNKKPLWIEFILKKGIIFHGKNILEKITSINEKKR